MNSSTLSMIYTPLQNLSSTIFSFEPFKTHKRILTYTKQYCGFSRFWNPKALVFHNSVNSKIRIQGNRAACKATIMINKFNQPNGFASSQQNNSNTSDKDLSTIDEKFSIYMVNYLSYLNTLISLISAGTAKS